MEDRSSETGKKAMIARSAIIVRQAMNSGALSVPHIVSELDAGISITRDPIDDAVRVVVENLDSEFVQKALRVESAEQDGGQQISLYPAEMDSDSAHETFFAAAGEPDSETC